MSTSTPNFNLIKPAGSENVDIATINSNMDKLDAGVEPIHATQTVTGTNGSITISNALDAPLLNFTATGMGTPGVVDATEIGGASAMGSQTWDSPMILDVPIGAFDGNFTPMWINYGGGVGSNSFCPTAGTETGTLVYLNSGDLAALFDAAEEEDATVTSEGTSPPTVLFECPLPFSVASGSTVYCSHLKNRNVLGEEGIWANASTLYLRILRSHLTEGEDFKGLAALMRAIAMPVLYYAPLNPKGVDPENFFDFFVMLTPSESYTKTMDPAAVKLDNGSSLLMYVKISDYIALLSGGEPDLTPISSMSATCYIDSSVNRTQRDAMLILSAAALGEKTSFGEGAISYGGGAVGQKSSAGTGGAVGRESSAGTGGAVGQKSSTGTGGAVGQDAYAERGGAVGQDSSAGSGGAIGQESYASSGGAVGCNAQTTDGAAVGYMAMCVDMVNRVRIDAVQLGNGINSDERSMQVYGTKLLNWDGDKHTIPPALLIASVGAMTPAELALFKQALGIS